MRPSIVQFLVCTLLPLLLAGCDVLQQQMAVGATHSTPLPAHPLYVLAVSIDAYDENELVIVDKTRWQVARRVPLLAAAPWDFSQDPQGRIWVGYGAAPGLEKRVQVLAPDGSVLKTFSPCITPICRFTLPPVALLFPASKPVFMQLWLSSI